MASTDSLPGSGISTPQDTNLSAGTSADVMAPISSVNQASAVPRDNMIETAVRFLQNPKVQGSPLDQKRAFLQKKGLTGQEVEMAINRSGTRLDVAAAPAPMQAPVQVPASQAMVPLQGTQMRQQMMPYGQPVPSAWARWRDYMAVAVIVSGVSYGIYRLVQALLVPFYKSRRAEAERLDRLEASIQELNKSVLSTVEKVESAVTTMQGLLQQQQAKLDSIQSTAVTSQARTSNGKSGEVAEVKAEIASLKGLLLNRHQFPATPKPAPIPSWQQGFSPINTTPVKPASPKPAITASAAAGAAGAAAAGVTTAEVHAPEKLSQSDTGKEAAGMAASLPAADATEDGDRQGGAGETPGEPDEAAAVAKDAVFTPGESGPDMVNGAMAVDAR